ncbi:MAG TPA: glycosyltransferase, partial [Candidatus Moranbacteria bacterium]|nr:glycosyltransferase [Candidatus Moranbacteria bacterium]
QKIIYINATSQPGGGGVAEILQSLVPLMQSLKIKASWYTINPPQKFFRVTNKIHNGLQGKKVKLTQTEKEFYLIQSKKMASEIENLDAQLFVINDPQPLLIPSFSKKAHPAISRIHIDLSSPNPDTWKFISPYFKSYQKVILSIHDFINGNLPKEKVIIFPPAIYPLTPKNIPFKKDRARMILESLGINSSKLTIAQVSRLDPFKDPVGVIKAFYLAKKNIPDLQLILLAQNLAEDNPYSDEIFKEVQRYTRGDPDIFLFYDPKKTKYSNEVLVSAVQTAANVIIQKSLKEGFGLTVTEAMWKGKAVIAGNVGGIKIQIRNGYNGYLVSTVEHCASRIEELLKNKSLRETLGQRAKKSVAKNFLIPRLLRDHLKIAGEVVKK